MMKMKITVKMRAIMLKRKKRKKLMNLKRLER